VTRWIGRALLAAARWRVRQVARWKDDPSPVQERLLRRLIRAARDTRFGREHSFARVRSIADYQARVPLREYLDFKPWWDRLFEGERDVTWPGRIRYFPITSGTTAGNKLIPLSAHGVRNQLRAGRDVITFHLALTGDADLFAGKFLYLGGSTDLKRGPHDTLIGDLSAIMALETPRYVHAVRLPSREINFIADWEKKLQAMAEEALDEDVRGISGTPSWMMCLFERVLELRERRGRPAATLAEIWPNLSLVVHGGCSFEPYRRSFAELFGKPVHTLEVYPASEGFIAVQDRPGENDLLLLMDRGIFFEFVPVEELGKPAPRRLTVADVETGVNYALVLTTDSGLWSYVIGDTVRFTSLRPHRLRITGRTKQFLNAFGEHVIVEEVEEAIAEACRETGAEVQEFHIAPLFPERGPARPGHQWFVEFRRPPEDVSRFRDIADGVVQRKNDDYAAHRRGDAGMLPPEIVALPPGTFFAAMKSIGKLGGQHKVPRLSNDRTFAEKLLRHARRGDA